MHPAFKEMKESRESKLNSMVGSDAHHEHPYSKAQRLATGGSADGTPNETDMPQADNPVKDTTHFLPQADFDSFGTMGEKTGPTLGEAQTDEVGATRRMNKLRGGYGMRDRPYDPGAGAKYRQRGDYEQTKANRGGRIKRADGGTVLQLPTPSDSSISAKQASNEQAAKQGGVGYSPKNLDFGLLDKLKK